eukprot:1741986-Rhodomonas_salina.1
MDNVIPPSAAAAPDALASLLQGAIQSPFPTDNGCDDDFVDERSDGEGNEVVQQLGGQRDQTGITLTCLIWGLRGLLRSLSLKILQKFQQLGGGGSEGGVADVAVVAAAAAAGALLL